MRARRIRHCVVMLRDRMFVFYSADLHEQASGLIGMASTILLFPG